MYNFILLSISSSCVDANELITVDRVFGSRIDGIKLGRKIGLPTINILLDLPLKCGIYESNSYHGPATIIVGRLDQRKVFVNFMEYKPILDTFYRFEFWNLKRIINKDSDFVDTFNKGCC